MERVRFLTSLTGEEPREMIFYGGFVAGHAYGESQAAYINGCFIACVILCQIVLEHTLCAFFALEGRDDLRRASFQRLLQEAVPRYLNDAERDAFDSVRPIRNSYVHGGDERAVLELGRRAEQQGSTMIEMLEQNARVALSAVARLLRRGA